MKTRDNIRKIGRKIRNIRNVEFAIYVVCAFLFSMYIASHAIPVVGTVIFLIAGLLVLAQEFVPTYFLNKEEQRIRAEYASAIAEQDLAFASELKEDAALLRTFRKAAKW